MSHAQTLVRTVVRGFYDSEHIVAVDALVNHIALNNDDFRVIFANTGRQNKDIQKILNHLKNGGMIAEFVRPELKPGAQKPSNVQWWYIDYRRAIDTTKFRLHSLESKLNASQKATEKEKLDWKCPRCKAEYGELDVLDSVDYSTGNFVCKKCAFPKLEEINHDANEPGTGTGSDSTIGVFNRQFGPIVRLLKQIDEVHIDAVIPEAAIALAVPVPRTIEPNDFARVEPLENKILRPTAVKGLTPAVDKVSVSITTDADNAAQAAAAEAERKRKKDANAVPEWYTHSTVSNDITAIGAREAAAREAELDGSSSRAETAGYGKSGQDNADDSLNAFFAALEEEKQARVAEEAAEDEDAEDEEFEDVDVAGTDAEPSSKRLKLETASETGSIAATPAQDSDEDDFEDA